ncbi:MAG: DUF983 domain-containing protein [Gemmatimonadaceae bacterium]|nr:DUF983 domain-containing protein [Chitinophagaceae bacterium]
MCAVKSDDKPGLILSILRYKCPRCRRGNLFQKKNTYDLKNFMKMNERCEVCGQPFEVEVGFYYGTGFVSYGLAVAISGISLVLWALTIGLSLDDNRFFWWMGINALLLVAMQPILMRLSRSLWIAIFVPYSKNWASGDIIEAERINKDQMNNW